MKRKVFSKLLFFYLNTTLSNHNDHTDNINFSNTPHDSVPFRTLLATVSFDLTTIQPHKDPRCNMALPCSSYSSLVTHMFLKVAKLAKILPPTHAESFLSGGAEIRILVLSGARALTSYSNRSPNPGNIVDPPDRTMFEKRVDRRSISD
mmetsp:Transcript_9146/g.19522  ORF Transcript_9146/g.19522 Transcript_9146/m.19522 type:complete len:149 (+) Transcript_9146:1-447(+)